MSQPVPTGNEFTWSGSLEETDIRHVYERCQRLRLTGRLELISRSGSGPRSVEVIWLGGEPAEMAGGQETRELMLWEHGEFLVTQRLPDFDGTLRNGVEAEGALGPGLVQRISELCADHRLSADVHLQQQSGASAEVRFTHGKAESATIDGQPLMALQALALLARWRDGVFRLRLRPLFGEEPPIEAPIIVEKETGRGSFDVTGAIPIPSLWEDAKRSPSRPPTPRRPQEPSVEIDLSPSYAEIMALSEAEHRRPSADATQPTPRSQISARVVSEVAVPAGTAPPSSKSVGKHEGVRPESARSGMNPARAARQKARSPWGPALMIGLIGGLAAFLCVGILKVVLPRIQARQNVGPPQDNPSFPAPTRPPAKAGALSAVRPEPKEPKESKAPPTQPAQQPSPAPPPPPRPEVPSPPSAPEEPQQAKATPERSREVRAMVERAQRMIVEGRVKKAQEVLTQAAAVAPADTGIDTLLKQARGELGHGELVIGGKGSALINGHKVELPRKMRVMAGPYLINGKEVEVRDGEQLHVTP